MDGQPKSHPSQGFAEYRLKTCRIFYPVSIIWANIAAGLLAGDMSSASPASIPQSRAALGLPPEPSLVRWYFEHRVRANYETGYTAQQSAANDRLWAYIVSHDTPPPAGLARREQRRGSFDICQNSKARGAEVRNSPRGISNSSPRGRIKARRGRLARKSGFPGPPVEKPGSARPAPPTGATRSAASAPAPAEAPEMSTPLSSPIVDTLARPAPSAACLRRVYVDPFRLARGPGGSQLSPLSLPEIRRKCEAGTGRSEKATAVSDFLTTERLGPQQSLTPEGFLVIRAVPSPGPGRSCIPTKKFRSEETPAAAS